MVRYVAPPRHYPFLMGLDFPQNNSSIVWGYFWTQGNQMVAVARSSFYQLCLVRNLLPFLDSKDLVAAMHALVTFRLDYYSVLCVGLPMRNV